MIFGAEARPSTVTIAVTSLRHGARRRSGAAGRGCRRAAASPRRTRCAGRGCSSRPRRRSNWPTGWMSAVVPCTPELAAELDVEAAAAHEDLVRRAHPDVEADAVRSARPRLARGCADAGRGPASPRTGGGVARGPPGPAPPGRWRRAPRPPRSRSARGRSARRAARRRRPAARASRACRRPGADEGAVGVATLLIRAVRSAGKPAASVTRPWAVIDAAARRRWRGSSAGPPRCPPARRRARCSRAGRWSADRRRSPPVSVDGAAELRRRERAARGARRRAAVPRDLRGALGQERVGDRQRHACRSPARRAPGRRAACGRRPEIERRPAPVARAVSSCSVRAAEVARRGEAERPACRSSPAPSRRRPRRAGRRSPAGSASGPVSVPAARDGAAQPAVAGHPVDQRQREGLSSIARSRLPGPSGTAPSRRAARPLPETTGRSRLQPPVRGLAAGVERHRRQPGAAGHRRGDAGGRELGIARRAPRAAR